MTERTEMRSRIQRVKQSSADKTLVRSKKLELTMHKCEEFFFEWRLTKTRIVTNGGYRVIDFFFEEKESNVLFGSEVIKHCAFGNSGSSGDSFRGCCIESFGLEESEGCFDNAIADRLFALRSLTGFASGF